jgi:CDP-4-dehydro-6-deoxyglucose reductase, E1
MTLDHPLMQNNISREDLDALIDYLQQDEPRLTQGENVRKFEAAWSDWLGVRHSVFVNSGSSANLITLAVLKQLYGEGEVIVPPLTWVSDIAACLHNGFKPIFVDISANTLGLDTEKTIAALSQKTKAVFLTHAQGFNALSQELLDELEKRNIPLIEDVCESHGAKFNTQRLGSYGLMSNFSFYFAHHMSTIEGGMVCTNDSQIYQMLRMYRSHGMVREADDSALRQQYAENNAQLNPDFIFAFPGYNLRNTELGAVLGRSQLKRLDANNRQRIRNHELFISQLDPARFRTSFDMEGSCNYAFNIVLNRPDVELRDRLESGMRAAGVEFRRGSAGGGNQLRQPYLKDVVKQNEWEEFPETEHIHFFGWYIGNFPGLARDKITQLCDLLNNA